ncbi:MAG TPA: penicillin-binding transpeptidase domain-containing protein [Chitinophagaceae bacterium]|nr:penicillin-binding transpeptidase domain-containing protein [Chitinophagaceae bacterium]
MKILSLLTFIIVLLAACSPNNVDEDPSLKKYFDEQKVTGTFGLFDNARGKFSIYELKKFKDSTYLPASTFKIVNSLIGLEIGRVKDDSTIFKWDPNYRFMVEACNGDLPMFRAFRMSCVPWFQTLARMIGKDTMQKWIDTLGYAQRYKKPIIGKVDSFWLDNSIKVTADEQLGLVKRLYFQQLPFQPRTQRIVKSMMLMEDNSNYQLSYKTGWAHIENNHSIGWIVGWIEENRHPYFFALLTESPDPNADPALRLKILKNILKQYGFFEGKK